MGPIQSAINQSLTGSAFMLGFANRSMKELKASMDEENANMEAETKKDESALDKMRTEIRLERPSDAMMKAKQHLMESINMKKEQADRSEEFKKALKNKPAGFYTNQQIIQMGGLSK